MSGTANPLQWTPPSADANPLATYNPHPAPDPMDYSQRYNTPLTAAEEPKYQAWVKSLPPNLQNSRDYDLQGAWKADLTPSANSHLPDQFKKPNHATFSDQSVYHGVDGNQGGAWGGGTNGAPWTFTPGATNLNMRSPLQLQQYFQQAEPDSQLVLP